MNITFFIGNGLDVGMGLDTRYSDFYKTLSTESKNRIEKDIADKTQSSDEKDKLYWKDYELGLGEATVMYEESEFETFKKDKSDLDHKIANYIKHKKKNIPMNIFQITAKVFWKT